MTTNITTSSSPTSADRILSIRFNQDATCLSLTSTHGVRIFCTSPFALAFERSIIGVRFVEMLFRTSLLFLVGSGDDPSFSPRMLRLYNTKNNKTLCELTLVTSVLNVKANMVRLVVVLEEKVHVLDTRSMRVLHSFDTAPNRDGLCALSPSDTNCLLVLPASDEIGDVYIYNALNLTRIGHIHAHQSPCRVLAFSFDGSMLATCSAQGTVVRIFSMPDQRKLHTFRRGSMAASVKCIAFDARGTRIVLSSSTSGTVHVFSLVDTPSLESSSSSGDLSTASMSNSPITAPAQSVSSTATSSTTIASSSSSSSSSSPTTATEPATSTSSFAPYMPSSISSFRTNLPTSSSISSYISTLSLNGISNLTSNVGATLSTAWQQIKTNGVSTALPYLPPSVTDYVQPDRHFASVSLKDAIVPAACAFHAHDSDLLMVVTTHGYFYTYTIAPTGGKAKLHTEQPLLDRPSDHISSAALPNVSSNYAPVRATSHAQNPYPQNPYPPQPQTYPPQSTAATAMMMVANSQHSSGRASSMTRTFAPPPAPATMVSPASSSPAHASSFSRQHHVQSTLAEAETPPLQHQFYLHHQLPSDPHASVTPHANASIATVQSQQSQPQQVLHHHHSPHVSNHSSRRPSISVHPPSTFDTAPQSPAHPIFGENDSPSHIVSSSSANEVAAEAEAAVVDLQRQADAEVTITMRHDPFASSPYSFDSLDQLSKLTKQHPAESQPSFFDWSGAASVEPSAAAAAVVANGSRSAGVSIEFSFEQQPGEHQQHQQSAQEHRAPQDLQLDFFSDAAFGIEPVEVDQAKDHEHAAAGSASHDDDVWT